MFRRLPFARLFFVAAILGATANFLSGKPIDFNREVRPILSDRCFHCHGPDSAGRKADLRLDNAEDAAAVLSPGDPDKSEVVARILSHDPDEQMPPPELKRPLSKKEMNILRRWVEEGAHYDKHWSYKPLAQPRVPAVTDKQWPRHAIDKFILHRLESENLKPTSEASRERLIRRLTFDLTGLPPTLEEIDAFLADDRPDAYERVVDSLIARPEFGERMATPWLDIARYSDTYGFQVDRDRFVWPWRDWVIRAINENLPYDEFITWQLAGDLLPDATRDQILATTFNRLHPQKVEGGSDPEEFRVEYVADRVHTFGTAFLGLTLECSRCHDHKYDPIAQKEYYQLFSYFQNIDEAGLYSFFTPAIPTPALSIPSDSEEAKLKDLSDALAAEEEDHRRSREETLAAFDKLWQAPSTPFEWMGMIGRFEFEEFVPFDEKGEKGKKDAKGKRGSTLNRLSNSAGESPAKTDPKANPLVEGKNGMAIRLNGDEEVNFEIGNFARHEPFSVALWMWTPDLKDRAVIFHRSRAWTDAASRGYQLLLEDGKLSASLIHFWPGNAIRIRALEPLPVKEWRHVAVTYDGSSRASGLRIFVDGEAIDCETVRDNLTREIRGGGGDHIAIGARFRDRGFTGGKVDEFTVFDRRISGLEVRELVNPGVVDRELASATADPADLREYFLLTESDTMNAARQSLLESRKAHNEHARKIKEIMVMRELPEPKPAFILERGHYQARGELVSAAVPAALALAQSSMVTDRRELAEWLVANPLTARVTVNQFWQTIFGDGLVRTPEDFGSQGEPPTHPDLLEWLARDFTANGWDMKRLIRQLVISAAYRQDSTIDAEIYKLDPGNRLLSRAHRYRLPAEMIRDQALAASGLYVRRLGGPPVKPAELAESFKPAKPDKGEGRYRRSLYTYWRRTGPAPVMMALDAAKRDVCTVKRERTDTPLQALVLMNDPLMLECAEKLAVDAMAAHPGEATKAISRIFRTLTGRQPDDREARILRDLFDDQRLLREQDDNRESAQKDAMTVVANTILSFDECVMKR